jgi:hypothetical protein
VTEEFKNADINGDGVISPEEFQLELKRKNLEIEDADAQRDQQRKMVWYVLFGMLGYGLDNAANLLSAMASIYFPATSLILAAFFGAAAYQAKKG